MFGMHKEVFQHLRSHLPQSPSLLATGTRVTATAHASILIVIRQRQVHNVKAPSRIQKAYFLQDIDVHSFHTHTHMAGGCAITTVVLFPFTKKVVLSSVLYNTHAYV